MARSQEQDLTYMVRKCSPSMGQNQFGLDDLYEEL